MRRCLALCFGEVVGGESSSEAKTASLFGWGKERMTRNFGM
jgi:hypothetical protein